MAANQLISDADNEQRMINQFTQGLHDKIVRSDVKRYVLSHSKQEGFASWHVLDAAKYYAKDHGVVENYYKAYSDSMSLLMKRSDSGSKLNISNVNNTEKERSSETKMHEYKATEFNKPDASTAMSRTPDTPQDMNKNQVTQPNRLSQVTCYNCQQKGHVSQYCRNKKVSTPRVEEKQNIVDKQRYNGTSAHKKD